jgi:hypothetical protein
MTRSGIEIFVKCASDDSDEGARLFDYLDEIAGPADQSIRLQAL